MKDILASIKSVFFDGETYYKNTRVPNWVITVILLILMAKLLKFIVYKLRLRFLKPLL